MMRLHFAQDSIQRYHDATGSLVRDWFDVVLSVERSGRAFKAANDRSPRTINFILIEVFKSISKLLRASSLKRSADYCRLLLPVLQIEDAAFRCWASWQSRITLANEDQKSIHGENFL